MTILFNVAVAAVALGVYFTWGLVGSGILILLWLAAYGAIYVVQRRNESRLTSRLLQMSPGEREAAIALLDADTREEVRSHMKKAGIP